MNFMDFHCHLDMKAFDSNRRDIVAEFFNLGYSRLVIAADPYETNSLEKTREILSYHPNIYCTVGAHPHNADHYSQSIEKNILDFIPEIKAVAVGEAGLDFHYNLSTPENQLNVFKRQIAIAQELQMPLVIHSREAETLVLKILEEVKFSFPVVFHCYTGNMEDAQEILKRGYNISISGIVTFRQKKTDYLRDIVREIPLNQLFTETDSPYLAPEPFRGNPNTPLLVRYVAEKVAEIKGIAVEELNRCVNKNFERLCPQARNV